MENNIPQITFAIASKNNFRYVKHAVNYIRENCYRKDHIIHIGIDGEDVELENYYKNDNGIVITKGVSGIAAIYNDIAKKATTDFILIYHADMIAGKDMDLNLYKHWKRGLIVSATRIEPPLHPGDPAKIVENFGMWPEEDVADGFKKEEFNQFVESNLTNDKITKGVFAPWLIHKEDYWAVDGHDETLNSHSEDRDLFNRFLLNGFDFIQPWNALVYHLTCRGGQFEHATKTEELKKRSDNWNQLARNNTREFLRKWGTSPKYDEYQYPIVSPKYNIGLVVHNCNLSLLELLEPMCDRIYVDEVFEIGRAWDYVEIESEHTNYDLSKRIAYIGNQTPSDYEDIIIEFDAKRLTNDNFQFLFHLGDIIKESGDVGVMEWDIFRIEINNLSPLEMV
jgi:GT2 family glycosyltransferase